MNFLHSALMTMALNILKLAMPYITAGLRDLMIESVKKWREYAETTETNFDNLVVEALESILGLSNEKIIASSDAATGSGVPIIGA